jgi:hypothetical protein
MCFHFLFLLAAFRPRREPWFAAFSFFLSFRHGTRSGFATLGFIQQFPPLGIQPPCVSAFAWRTHYGPCDGASFGLSLNEVNGWKMKVL